MNQYKVYRMRKGIAQRPVIVFAADEKAAAKSGSSGGFKVTTVALEDTIVKNSDVAIFATGSDINRQFDPGCMIPDCGCPGDQSHA